MVWINDHWHKLEFESLHSSLVVVAMTMLLEIVRSHSKNKTEVSGQGTNTSMVESTIREEESQQGEPEILVMHLVERSIKDLK